MNYLQEAREIEQYVISIRRHFHRHPELPGCEEQTVARICRELDEMQISYVNVPNGGVIGFLGCEGKDSAFSEPSLSACKDRTVLLRADIDALPCRESAVNGGQFPKVAVSENDDAAHLCGHDCHAAMLLGAAKALKAHEAELPGRIILMFERGEEGGGNIAWLLKWLFENHIKIDTSFAAHITIPLPAGKLGVCDSGVLAGALGFSVKLIGISVHGAMPSAGSSPIDCFVSIYNTIQSMRMKYANPYDPMVFSVGTVHAGTAGNVIPGELTFSGSFRAFNFEDAMRVREQLIKTIDLTAQMYGCKAEYGIGLPSLGVINDAECAAFTKSIYASHFGTESVVTPQPAMGSESHSMTSKIWPGTYIFVGAGNPEKGMTAPNHNEHFEPDEAALSYGVAAYMAYAVEFLKNGPDTSDRIYTGDLKEFYQKYNQGALAAFEE